MLGEESGPRVRRLSKVGGLVPAVIAFALVMAGQSAKGASVEGLPHACTPLTPTTSFGLMPNGDQVEPGTPGSTLVQEFQGPQGTTFSLMTDPGQLPPGPPCQSHDVHATFDTEIMAGRVGDTSGVVDVRGTFTIPTTVFNCNPASGRAMWDGIGGFFSTSGLIQAGITDNGVNTYKIFFEVEPFYSNTRGGGIEISNPAVQAGDVN